MKRKTATHAAGLLCVIALALSIATSAYAIGSSELTPASPCYPTAVTRSDDGSEIRKMYDLGPQDSPAGIPRSDFEQDGYYYTMTDLLKQELPANESRQHTETVSVDSASKDMASVLALLPETKEFITEDGLSGVLTLKLDSVNVEVAGYGSSTRSLTATRTYPGLANQDTQYIPKSIQDNGNTLNLQTVNWQTEGDGHFTAVVSYSGSATSSYVKGYTVTADYTGTVSRINLNRIRYTQFLSGMALATDTWSALSVLSLREKNPAIKLHCILPCTAQAEKWSASSRELYRSILEQADSVVYVSREYHKNCMLERNRFLVEHASGLLAVYNGARRSGTGATVNYARKMGRKILIIDPVTLSITQDIYGLEG